MVRREEERKEDRLEGEKRGRFEGKLNERKREGRKEGRKRDIGREKVRKKEGEIFVSKSTHTLQNTARCTILYIPLMYLLKQKKKIFIFELCDVLVAYKNFNVRALGILFPLIGV